MAKEKVYIVLSHKNSLKKGSRTEWEVTEKVEFVNQLKDKHITMSSAIADYLNEKMQSGKRYGFVEYEQFETYIRGKYSKQMQELDAAYKPARPIVENDNSEAVFVDEFGNIRTKTVFDV